MLLSIGEIEKFYLIIRNVWDYDLGFYDEIYSKNMSVYFKNNINNAGDEFEKYFRDGGQLSPLDKVLYTEFHTKMVNDYLLVEDRMSMAHSVEERVPLLDMDLVNFGFSIPVELKIRAKDVIHSVFIPHFRLQMNAVPGMATRFWFTPTKTTEEMRAELDNPDFNYELVCNKICGKAHFAMRYIVVVDDPEDYEEWKAKQQPWLKNNPDYLSKVPDKLKNLALIKAQINETKSEKTKL
jgi:hypothetical protein